MIANGETKQNKTNDCKEKESAYIEENKTKKPKEQQQHKVQPTNKRCTYKKQPN